MTFLRFFPWVLPIIFLLIAIISGKQTDLLLEGVRCLVLVISVCTMSILMRMETE